MKITQGKKYSYLSSNFKEHFGDMEVVKSKVKLVGRTLEKPMTDKEILSKWNPEPVTLGDMDNFLETADHKVGYIFYIKDLKGVLWAVRVFWYGDGWYVDADSVEYAYDWRADNQVFSRRFDPLTLSPSDTLPPFIMVGEVKYKRE